jgi:hypothetical protein
LQGGGDLSADRTLSLVGLSSLGTANYLLGVNPTATALEYKQLLGTTNQITVSHSGGKITLSLPQDIATTSSPTFTGLTLSNLTNCDTIDTDASGNLLCGTDAAGGAGLWAESTDLSFIYPTNSNYDVVLGSNATSSAPFWFDVSQTTLSATSTLTLESRNGNIVLNPSGNLNFSNKALINIATINSLNLPSSDFVGLTDTQTLTNKTISTGSTWQGNIISTTYGGTGLGTIGTANQLLGVNSGASALEYKDIASLLTAGSNISISGTNIATISTISSPSFANLIISDTATTSQLVITSTSTLGTIISGNWQGNTITDTYISNTLTLTGGSIDNVPIGATTPSTGAFTTLTAATTTLSGPLNLQNNIISNIGAAGTDFTTGGGLTLAGTLTVNGQFTLGDNGDTGAINTSDWDISTTGDLTGIGTINSLNLPSSDFVGLSDTQTLTNKTLSTGSTWQGDVISTTYGGTGQDWSNTATGSLPYFSAQGTMATLAVGSANSVLYSDGSLPLWGTIGSASITDNSLDWQDLANTMTLDATTTIAMNYPLNFDSGTLYIDAANNRVGIGTTGPADLLHVAGTIRSGNIRFWDSSLPRKWTIGVRSDESFFIYDRDADANRLIITNTGNVGIGTTSPATKLEVSGDITLSAGAARAIRFPADTWGRLYSGSYEVFATNWRNMYLKAGESFVVDTNGITRMTITSTGNVGIGTTAPNYQLHIWRSSTGANGIIVENALATDAEHPAEIVFKRTGIAATQHAAVGVDYTARDFFIWVNGQDRLNIDTNGNVGIGTRNPGTYKLRVQGTVCFDTNNDGTCDYTWSDIAMKENLSDLQNALGTIQKLHPVEFNFKQTEEFKDFYLPTTRQMGLIAQEVEPILPQVVSDTISGYKIIKYEKLVPLLIAGIQEQQKEIEGIKIQLNGEGGVENKESLITNNSLLDNFVEKVKQALASLGLFIENGIARVKELITDKIVTDVARVKQFEMIDKATGEIYCTWIENGQWVKVKGECGKNQKETPNLQIPISNQTPTPNSQINSNLPSSPNSSEEVDQNPNNQEIIEEIPKNTQIQDSNAQETFSENDQLTEPELMTEEPITEEEEAISSQEAVIDDENKTEENMNEETPEIITKEEPIVEEEEGEATATAAEEESQIVQESQEAQPTQESQETQENENSPSLEENLAGESEGITSIEIDFK